jgi:AcrR family transcriptional regulator
MGQGCDSTMTTAAKGDVEPAISAPAGESRVDAVQRRRGATLEDAILGAAYAELSEVGYAAFTVEGVAARARTGKASIYRRWPTRNDLLLDAICSQLPTPADCGLTATIPDHKSTADALRDVARMITRVSSSAAGDVIRAIKCEAVTDPDLARAIDVRFQAPRREYMTQLFRRGIERGEVRPDIDIKAIAEVLPALLTYKIVLQREPISGAAISAIMEQVMIPLIEPR